MMLVEKLYSENGINIFNIKEDKFKTNSVSIFFVDNLSRETVSRNALMIAMLKRGTNKYPKTLDLEKRKDELYRLSFGSGGYKKGETYIMHFFTNVINDKFKSFAFIAINRMEETTKNIINSLPLNRLLNFIDDYKE